MLRRLTLGVSEVAMPPKTAVRSNSVLLCKKKFEAGYFWQYKNCMRCAHLPGT